MATSTTTENGITLSESIANSEQALALCLCNKFTEAEKFLEPLNNKCIYHMLSKSTISYLQALLTYEPEYIEKAYEKVKVASQVCDKARKKQTWSETLHNWVGRPYFDDFTELELHAELCYAECLLERAMLTFIQDENLISFIKGGLKVRNAYNLYRNCLLAMQQKPRLLEASSNRVDFESGVCMGMGSFNVLLSLLPPRVLRLLEWVGFSGDKRLGLSMLDEGFQLDGLRSPMCTITLLGYQIVVSPLLGIGDTDNIYSQSILDVYLQKFPDSSIFLYFSGRLKQTQCLLDEALKLYEKSVSINMDWQQIHHICYWEMMWCYCFKGDWSKAAEFANKLATESKWSKSSYLFFQSSFLLMQQFELSHGNIEQVKEARAMTAHIENLLHNISRHKQRIAGKSIPFEKFAVNRVDKYFATGQLVIPALELIHIWNGFSMFSTHVDTLEKFLNLIQIARDDLELIQDTSTHHHDNINICKLSQGICLRHLKQYADAEIVLNEVAASSPSQHSSKMDCYLPPYASAELGFMYRSMGENIKALHQLQHTLKHYSKYGLESRLHFRVHSGIETLKELLRNGSENKQKDEEIDGDAAKEEDDEDIFFDIEEPVVTETYRGEIDRNNKTNLQGSFLDPSTNYTKETPDKEKSSVLIPLTNEVEEHCSKNNNLTQQKNIDLPILLISNNATYSDGPLPSLSHSAKSPRLPWFRKKRSTSTKSESPLATPPTCPDLFQDCLSEASSDILPIHSFIASPRPEQLCISKVTSL